jgi:hypothetical protein
MFEQECLLVWGLSAPATLLDIPRIQVRARNHDCAIAGSTP